MSKIDRMCDGTIVRPMPTTITRVELYEQIWNDTLRSVAKRYGLSDVGLAKICKRLDVPRPPQGHWQRIQHGHKIVRPPLPPLSPGIVDHFVVEPPAGPIDEHAREPRPPTPTITVTEELSNPHPAVHQLALLVKDVSQDVRTVPHDGQATYRVSAALHQRALRILDALCRWIDGEGYVVTFDPVPNDKYCRVLSVRSGEHAFRISMIERQRQIDHVATAAEKANMLRYPSLSWVRKFDYVPSGQLTLEFLDRRSSYPRYGRWNDGKRSLESRLGNAALGVGVTFARLKADRLRREEEARLERLAAQRRERERRREEHDQLLRDDLHQMVENWERANRIRAFVRAFEAEIIATCRQAPVPWAWITWARAYANAIDPLRYPSGIPKLLEPPDPRARPTS